jgi:hypothetical protein
MRHAQACSAGDCHDCDVRRDSYLSGAWLLEQRSVQCPRRGPLNAPVLVAALREGMAPPESSRLELRPRRRPSHSVGIGNEQVKKSLIAAPAAALAVIGIGLAPNASAAHPVNEMAAKYGTGPIPVEVGPPLASAEVQETVAQADHGRAIVLNDEYANLSPQEFSSKLAANIANGFNPGGCDGGVRMAAIHEVGHILDHRKMLALDNRRNAVGMAVQSGQISKLRTPSPARCTTRPSWATRCMRRK